MDRWIDEGQRERQRNLKLRILSTFVTAALFSGFRRLTGLGSRQIQGLRRWHVSWRVSGEGDPEDLERWLRQVPGEKHKVGIPRLSGDIPGLIQFLEGFFLHWSPGMCMTLTWWLPCKGRDPWGPKCYHILWVPQWAACWLTPPVYTRSPRTISKRLIPE